MKKPFEIRYRLGNLGVYDARVFGSDDTEAKRALVAMSSRGDEIFFRSVRELPTSRASCPELSDVEVREDGTVAWTGRHDVERADESGNPYEVTVSPDGEICAARTDLDTGHLPPQSDAEEIHALRAAVRGMAAELRRLAEEREAENNDRRTDPGE